MFFGKLMILIALLGTAAPKAPHTHHLSLGYFVRAEGHALVVHGKPDGPSETVLPARTEFGTPTAVAVIGHKHGWLRVAVPDGSGYLPPKTSVKRDRYQLRADLGAHTLTVFKNRHRMHQFTIGVGAEETPTPRGRFGITDKLENTFAPDYGCCVIALTARQHHLPPGWPGGNIVAIHGTDEPQTIGADESNGCLHLGDTHMRYLMRRVPLGTVVIIHR